MQVLAIGLDGVCQPILDPMLADGILPAIADIKGDGSSGPLESQLPPWTPSAWPSMYTGVNPGKHGVFDFLHFNGYDWDIVNFSHVKEFAIWELLSLRGYTSVVVNVPVTHPPREFDGALVSGYVGPDRPTYHPSSIEDELHDAVKDYSVYGSTLDSTASDETIGAELSRLATLRGKAFCHLIDQFQPDFGFVQFQATDTVFHDCPDNDEMIRSVFEAVDQAVGQITDACDADLTLVVSDHGMGRMGGYEFRVNDYLREHEFLTTTGTGDGMPSWQSDARNETEMAASGGVTAGAKAALEFAARIGITSQRIGRLLQFLRLEAVVRRAIPVDVIRAGTERVDFPASTAYMRTRTEMGVRLNLEGREPNGVVPATEYDEVRAEVMGILQSATTADGMPVFEAVLPRESVFDGPYLEDAPDVITVPDQFDHFLVANLKGSLFGPPTEPWEHKRNGIVMAAGEGVDNTNTIVDAHLFDIAPTILAAFDLPVSDRMDGQPLSLVEPTPRESYPPFQPQRQVATDDEAVEDRLEALGYLE